MPVITKSVEGGGWRTLETFWNVNSTALFVGPAGAQVRLLYGISPFTKERQKHVLDGIKEVRLGIGVWSLTRVRLQIRTRTNANVTYSVLPGEVAKVHQLQF